MLKILCVFLQVLILMKADIAFSSEDLEEEDADVIFHYIINESQLVHVKNYIDDVTTRNKVASEKIPSEPTRPRVFTEFKNKLDKLDKKKEGSIIVKYRWEEPQFTNGRIQKYTVRCWNIGQLKYLNYIHNVSFTKVQIPMVTIDHGIMYFQVRAHNENGAGPYTKFINVSTIEENSVPLVLISSPSANIFIIDADSTIIYQNIEEYRAKEIIYSALEHKIYWINEMSELILYNFDIITLRSTQKYRKILNLDSSAHNLCIDWITRNLYWIQFSNHIRNIMKLDLTLWEQMGIDTYDSILEIHESKFLNILPFEGYFYWMELNSKNQYVIRQSDLHGKNIKTFLEDKNDTCFCSYKLREASAMQIDNTNIDKPIMYWTSNNHLIATEIYGCGCDLLLRFENETVFNYLTIDKTNIYLFSRIEQSNQFLIMLLNKKIAHSVKNPTSVTNLTFPFFINSVIVAERSLQPYPRTMCLIPKTKNYLIEVIGITANSIVVKLPEPDLNDGCDKYRLATTIYNISVSHCVDNDVNKFKYFNVLTHQRHFEIQNLTPLTEYKLELALNNFYVDMLSMKLQFGEDVIQKTAPGKLNAPENVTVQVLTPTQAAVYWMPPKNLNCVAVNYEVHWRLDLFPNDMRTETYQNLHNKQLLNKFERTVDRKFLTTIERLQPEQEYFIFVRVYPVNFSHFFTDSLLKSVCMYSESNNLTLSGVNTNSMNISWIPSIKIISYKLEYKNVTMQEWELADTIEKNNDKVTHYLKNLHPGTSYNFRLILRYRTCMKGLTWPPNETFTFRTLDHIPSAPGRPQITSLPNSTHKTLEWKPAQVHDSEVISYYLEGLIVENNYKDENQTNHWKLYYYGADNHWLITESMNQKYLFRVQAKNAYGFGNWSETSTVVDLTESVEILPAHYYYLPLVLSLIVILVICNVYYFYRSYGQRKEINDQFLPATMTNIELATRSEMSFEYIQFNILYDSRLQRNLNKFNLKIIEKHQITLTKSIGSGEFGKVFQGTVKNLEESGSMSVAIKMLRKNASSQDREKFLQEAELMGRFRHRHVLRLLAICLNTKSPMLILELMEAGDLLKYLRESRTLQSSDPNFLRLQDLLAMCEDVARGCCYLEDLHFVHRDLACRNCLISSRNRETRIVKIGDFGLARDIYTNDYYRMKGEDLLPVRWMAPESLVDGIFTSQSDVWAFGVLMWEITSLGKQPYPTKNSIQVLGYVCAGGRLSKPLNCPSILYELMLHCWSAVKNRPNFLRCLENIVSLRNNIEDAILSSADIIKYAEVNG